ncbi:MAG: cytochrome c peroxidase [Polyangiaceae bacterium]
MRELLLLLLLLALTACGDQTWPDVDHGDDGPGTVVDPPETIALGERLPALRFDGVDADGQEASLSLADFAADEGLLLVTVHGGLWCGTCQVAAKGPVEESLRDLPIARLELVVADRDNTPAIAADAAHWQATFGRAVAVGADPEHRLTALLPGSQLPLFVVVERAGLVARDALANPSPAELRAALGAPVAEEPLVDGFFRPHEWALLQGITVPGAPPRDPSNAVADDPAAVALGRALFFDAGLSPSGTIACASCHQPEQALSDGQPVAMGLALGDRRTPSIALAAHARWQFWDGRADGLWAQALAPFENPAEMGSSRAFVAARVLDHHAAAYHAAFPDAPDLDDPTTPDALTRTFVNVGKAIAAWERSLRVMPNRFDAYLAGDLDALDEDEKYGLLAFTQNGCMQCHWGPRLTDDAFHNLRLPTGRKDGAPDRGRVDGLAAYAESPFRSDGPWSDAPEARTARSHEAQLGQFKTPPLRGVADLAYFGHGGSFGHLSEVMVAYGWGAFAELTDDSIGEREPWLGSFGETEQWGLVPFLRVLTAAPRRD